MIADEAHRSQYGFGGKVNERTGEMSYGFAGNLRDALPNASFIGLTPSLPPFGRAAPNALRCLSRTSPDGSVELPQRPRRPAFRPVSTLRGHPRPDAGEGQRARAFAGAAEPGERRRGVRDDERVAAERSGGWQSSSEASIPNRSYEDRMPELRVRQNVVVIAEWV